MSVDHASRKASVLLVARDESVRGLVADVLGGERLELFGAPAELADAPLAAFHLAFLDLPIDELAQVCSRLRALPRGKSPVVVALVDERDADAAIAAGADELLFKPVRRAELRVRARALVAMRRAETERQDMLTLFVHDLKSPLSAVILNTGMLGREQGLSDRARRCGQRITDATHNMRRMVLNLLDLTRAERTALVPQLASVDAEEIVADVIASFASRTSSSEHVIELRRPAGDIQLETDPELFRRLLDNLLDNALGHAPPKTVIAVEVETLDGEVLELRVRDEGPGIAETMREQIFEMRTPTDGQHEPQHRGLGLVFCRLALEALSGRIRVFSNEPQGSVFQIRHPLRQPSVAKALAGR